MQDDWSLENAAEINRTALLRVVAGVFVMLGLAPGKAVLESVPGPLRRSVLLVLRPAESALRRIIFIAARSVSVSGVARTGRSFDWAKQTGPEADSGQGARIRAFRLTDPRKRFFQRPARRAAAPMLTAIGCDNSHLPLCARAPLPSRPAPKPDYDPEADVSAKSLCLRLQSLHRALHHMPREARRMARLLARRAGASPGPKRVPLRPGWPPGYRKRHRHEIDRILEDCHGLALAPQRQPAPP